MTISKLRFPILLKSTDAYFAYICAISFNFLTIDLTVYTEELKYVAVLEDSIKQLS